MSHRMPSLPGSLPITFEKFQSKRNKTMTIPFVDLKLQYRMLKPQMDVAISSVLERSAYIMGKEHNDFEQSFAAYIGARHCLGVSTGTDALELAIRGHLCLWKHPDNAWLQYMPQKTAQNHYVLCP